MTVWRHCLPFLSLLLSGMLAVRPLHVQHLQIALALSEYPVFSFLWEPGACHFLLCTISCCWSWGPGCPTLTVLCGRLRDWVCSGTQWSSCYCSESGMCSIVVCVLTWHLFTLPLSNPVLVPMMLYIFVHIKCFWNCIVLGGKLCLLRLLDFRFSRNQKRTYFTCQINILS